QCEATVWVGRTRATIGDTCAGALLIALDVIDPLVFDQRDVVIDPVFVGAENQRFGTDFALQVLFGQCRTLIGPVVFIAEQGDVVIKAQRSQGDGELDARLRSPDYQQAGGLTGCWGLGSGVGGNGLVVCGYGRHD